MKENYLFLNFKDIIYNKQQILQHFNHVREFNREITYIISIINIKYMVI
jgi:hypothetical protein